MLKVKLDGRIPDIRKPEDLKARTLLKGLPAIIAPEEYHCIEYPPIMNQGGTSACVAYAHTLVRIIELSRKDKTVPVFNPYQLYLQCKQEDGIPNLAGTYPMTCLGIMRDHGMPVSIGGNCLCKGKTNFDERYKIGAYWRINLSDSDDIIKQIIMQFGPITAASIWYNEWMDMFSTGIFKEPVTIGGGHCYCIQGWNKTGWEVDNSWGTFEWGFGGIAYMPFRMFRDVVLPEADVWKIQSNDDLNKTVRRLAGILDT